MEALVCVRCGGPLPSGGGAEISCPWCGSTLRRRMGALEETQRGAGAPDPQARRRLVEALVAAVQSAREVTVEALAELAYPHLGPAGEAQAQVVARVTVGLAAEFERAHRVAIRGDAIAMARILEAYLRAFDEIRTTGRARISLPFLAATPSGPVHLERELTPEAIAALAQASHAVPAASGRPGCWPLRA